MEKVARGRCIDEFVCDYGYGERKGKTFGILVANGLQ